MTFDALVPSESKTEGEPDRDEELEESFATTIERVLVVSGTVVGGLGFLFFPIVLGPLAILAGALEAILYDIRRGGALIALGFGSLVIGLLIGYLTQQYL